MALMATVIILQQGIQTTFGIALSGAYTHLHCELHGHKQRIELSPLRQSGSGSGLGNQSSLHKLLTRDLTDILNEGEGKGRGGVYRGIIETAHTQTQLLMYTCCPTHTQSP